MGHSTKKRPIKERFDEKYKVNPDTDCWEWTARRNPGGYGEIGLNGKKLIASRVSYMIYVGELPDNIHVCHTCDNPPCVNPKHLFLGDDLDNTLDAQSKGRKTIAICGTNSKYNSGCRFINPTTSYGSIFAASKLACLIISLCYL